MYIAIDNKQTMVASALEMDELRTRLKTNRGKGVNIYKVYGENQTKLSYSEALLLGDIVRVANGDLYEVTKVERHGFMYEIDGAQVGGTKLASWTKDGFFYDQTSPDERDIVEVVI